MTLRIRPVGEPLRFRTSYSTFEFPDNVSCYWTTSGTEALALALQLLISSSKLPAKARPKVIVPAYGCPDMVSAIKYCGAEPVYVDLQPDMFWMNSRHLEESVSESTVAVILPHFLGLRHADQSNYGCLTAHHVSVVEDSAQRYPFSQKMGDNDRLLLTSFGRGKPFSGIGGGLLIGTGKWRRAIDVSAEDWISGHEKTPSALLFLRSAMHNLSLYQVPFTLLSQLPFMNVGDTKYRPLTHIRRASVGRERLFLNAIGSFSRGNSIAPAIYSEYLSSDLGGKLVDIPAIARERGPLLRYPLLAPTQAARDKMLLRLETMGLGASAMYRRLLPEIVDDSQDWAPRMPNAADFARRLITLPCHSGVNNATANRIVSIIDDILRRGPY